MSTDYGPYCVDCKEGFVIDNQRWPPDVAALTKAMQPIAKVLLESLPEEYRVSRWYDGPVDLAWFAKHADHNVVVWDEYGRIHPDCSERVACECCGSWYYCALQKGHEGPHAKDVTLVSTSDPPERR